MELAHKYYLQHAIQDVLDLLEKANSMIALHQSQTDPNEMAIEGYQRQRQEFVEQLAKLLSEYQVEVIIPNKAA